MREALLVPLTVGSKLTPMLQDAPTPTVAPHVDDTKKAAGCEPVTARFWTVSAVFPVFVTVIVVGAELEFIARL